MKIGGQKTKKRSSLLNVLPKDKVQTVRPSLALRSPACSHRPEIKQERQSQGDSSAKLHPHKPEMPDPTKELFESLDFQIRRYMQSIKLSNLVDEKIKRDKQFNPIRVDRHDTCSKGKNTFSSNSAFVNTNVAARQDVQQR
jgi:hypothetical protein